jgi:hypothetical protein
MRLIFVAINNKYMGHGGVLVEAGACRPGLFSSKTMIHSATMRWRTLMKAGVR